MLPTHDVHCPECGKFVYTALSLEEVFPADRATNPPVMTDAQGDYLACPHCGARIPLKRLSTKAGVAFRVADGAMKVREIPSREWPAFLDRLAREHRAWLATVDRGGRVEAREQPLKSIALDSGIDIRIGDRTIRIDEPQALRVEETPEGAAAALHIDDTTGHRLTLRFRVAVAPGVLDGLAPAER